MFQVCLPNDNTLDNSIVRVVIDTLTGDISSLTRGAHEFVNLKSGCVLNSYRYLNGKDTP